ncbi:helix-turn-helix domain-containing protein [Glaciecola sp. 2405UD65-10]|uniref:helix-turn-helix domain-containing protein n=1 Tax=Glaciecola sp. 2405UD65-10 TaxID=3397244 RepID=UPI003B591C5B
MLFNFSNSEFAYFCLFVVAFSFLVKQAFTQQKQVVHILFAIFCASLCMMTIQKMTASSVGIYQYVIGFAACATCNVAWLISRALFRKENAISKRHICVAALIALLIVANQAWHMVNDLNGSVLSSELMISLQKGMGETTNLLSSTILLLSFWEALRGYSVKNKTEKYQRIIFAVAFFTAVFSTTFVVNVFVAKEAQAEAYPWFVFAAASMIIFAIEWVLLLQKQQTRLYSTATNSVTNTEKSTVTNIEKNTANHAPVSATMACAQLTPAIEKDLIKINKPLSTEEAALVAKISELMQEDKIYLQANIKLLDFAKALNAPEYKISRLIRTHFDSPNFNHFVNHYRVEYAKTLLASKHTSNWSILVIGLESGFTSLVSFNRAFKHLSGTNPSTYRVHANNDEQFLVAQTSN